MLKFLKSLFSGDEEEATKSVENDERIAAAALLIEAAVSDHEYQDAERDAIVRVLVRHYDISETEAREVLKAAEEMHAKSDQFFYFTRTINERFPLETRVQMIEMLWEIVYADGKVADYEAHLLRRIAGLLYVSDRDRGDARKRVMARLGIRGD